MHVEQANLVFEAKGVEPSRYRFEEANIFTHDFAGKFDIVLCLGLMYHISKPIELFEIIDRVGTEIVVIDTSVSFAPRGLLRDLRDRDLDDPRNAVDYEIVLVPTRGAVDRTGRGSSDYKTVSLAHNMTDYTGMHDYEIQRRLAFICARSIIARCAAPGSSRRL